VRTVGSAGLWDVELDTNHLESAIVNLAINARDATPDGVKLTIEAMNVSADEDYSGPNPELAPGQHVVLSVTDTGAGMTPDALSHSFVPAAGQSFGPVSPKSAATARLPSARVFGSAAHGYQMGPSGSVRS
jgi:Histidine kinase-, DNA gyrase B-, and HSP90-like ATPase